MMRTVLIAALVAAAAAIPMQQSDANKDPKLHRISLKKLAQTPRQVPPLQPCNQDPVDWENTLAETRHASSTSCARLATAARNSSPTP